MKKFAKPLFKDLLDAYKVEPSTVHDCTRFYTKNVQGEVRETWGTNEIVNTCAFRMSEALVIANRLVTSRAEISALTTGGGSGKGFLLGTYDYKNNLCPHGIGRGARDVAYFLKEHWGSPTYKFDAQTSNTTAPPEIDQGTGVLAFIKIPGYGGQGHMDLWNQTKAVGDPYFTAEKIWFWRLG